MEIKSLTGLEKRALAEISVDSYGEELTRIMLPELKEYLNGSTKRDVVAEMIHHDQAKPSRRPHRDLSGFESLRALTPPARRGLRDAPPDTPSLSAVFHGLQWLKTCIISPKAIERRDFDEPHAD